MNIEAEALYEQVLVIQRIKLGAAHLGYFPLLHNLAQVRQAMGRNAEAETLYEKVLGIKRAALGEAHP